VIAAASIKAIRSRRLIRSPCWRPRSSALAVDRLTRPLPEMFFVTGLPSRIAREAPFPNRPGRRWLRWLDDDASGLRGVLNDAISIFWPMRRSRARSWRGASGRRHTAGGVLQVQRERAGAAGRGGAGIGRHEAEPCIKLLTMLSRAPARLLPADRQDQATTTWKKSREPTPCR
jgi:hypothetical protein